MPRGGGGGGGKARLTIAIMPEKGVLNDAIITGTREGVAARPHGRGLQFNGGPRYGRAFALPC